MHHLINQRYTINRCLLVLLFVAALALTGGTALAQDPNTIIVNRSEDAVDALPGNGVCDADPNDKVLQCTLRAAIMEANALPGAQTVWLPSGTYRLALPGQDEDASRTGDLDITGDLTLIGRGQTQPIIDGGALDRVIHIVKSDNTQAALENVTIRNGSVPFSAGGGIVIESASHLTVTDSALLDNVANNGGALQFGRDTEVTLVRVLIQNNFAKYMGGGITANGRATIRSSTIIGNRVGQPNVANTGWGGGIMAGGDKPIVIEQSTIAGNSATLIGGGIGSVLVGTNLMLVNSTVSGNSAPSAAGIQIEEPIVLQHTTVTNNDGNGIRVGDPNATVLLHNSIIADNTAPACDLVSPTILLKGEGNLIGDSSCPFVVPTANISSTNPLLGLLQLNGGTTPTHALLPSSKAIDSANNAFCTPVDQRNVARPQGAGCDIGAFEASQ
ncbi:MAG: choice-of-anchor Q domain-containing protein [Caldilineaceae bacterium]